MKYILTVFDLNSNYAVTDTKNIGVFNSRGAALTYATDKLGFNKFSEGWSYKIQEIKVFSDEEVFNVD